MENNTAPIDDLKNDTVGTQNAPATATDANDGVLDLTSILTQPTQKRDETPAPDADADHSEPISNEVATFNTEKIESIKETTATFAQASVVSTYDTDKLADAIIDLGDTILTHSAPYIYESLLTTDERKGLKDLAKRYRKAQIEKVKFETTEADDEFIKIQVDIDEYEELMKLSEAEKESIKEPLKLVLKNVNFTASPQNSLLMSCAMIAVPRIIPLIPMMIKKFFPKSTATVAPIPLEIKKLKNVA